MAHYDNVINRVNGIANLSNSAKKLITNDILRNSQYIIIKNITDDSTLYAEYETLIQNTVPDKPYNELTADEAKLFHYEVAMANFVLSKLYIALKNMQGGTVALDRLNVGSSDLVPISSDDAMAKSKFYLTEGFNALSIATNGYVSSSGVELMVI